MRLGRLAGGLILVALGGVLLCNTLGYLTWSVWQSLIALWPVLLVGLGLAIATRKSFFLPLALLAIILWTALSPIEAFPKWPARQASFSVPLTGETTQASILLALGAARVNLSGGSPDLLDAHIQYHGDRPVLLQKHAGGLTQVSLEQTTGGGEWNIRLNGDVPFEIAVEAGASSVDLDLRHLLVSFLRVEAGASRVEVAFGEGLDYVETAIDTGASSVTVSVPRSMAVRVELQGALNSHNLADEGLIPDGDTWISPRYNEAQKRLDISVDAGVGSLQLSKY